MNRDNWRQYDLELLATACGRLRKAPGTGRISAASIRDANDYLRSMKADPRVFASLASRVRA